MRRYKLFFLLGLAILAVQIYLAVKFMSSNSENQSETNVWIPRKVPQYESESSVNSARRSRDSFVIDDEDASNVYYQKPSTGKDFDRKKLLFV